MVSNLPIRQQRANESGFTLIELIIVMAIVAILSAIAIPHYLSAIHAAKEAALRDDLHTLRTAITHYTMDQEKAPMGLDDLVQAGYIKKIPVDPMTNHDDTWITETSDSLMDVNETQGGIDEVHSGAQGQAINGSLYSSW